MKKIYLFVCLVLCTFSIIISSKAEINKRIIVLDPGHGGMDGGAIVGEIKESDLVLDICFKIKSIFENKGYIVIMTRNDRESLCDGKFIKKEDMNKRVNIINESNASAAISIHLNKFSISKYRGAQVFYSCVNYKNKQLAEQLQNSFELYLNDTKRKPQIRENLYLLKRVSIPCCIVECGFMSNPEEFSLLLKEEYQYKIGYSILFAIDNFLK